MGDPSQNSENLSVEELRGEISALKELLRRNGRGLVQMSLKLSELVREGNREPSSNGEDSKALFATLSELIEGLDGSITASEALERKLSASSPPIPAWWPWKQRQPYLLRVGSKLASYSPLWPRKKEPPGEPIAASRALREGLESLRSRVLEALAERGITPVPRQGPFDPRLQQAIGTAASDNEEIVRTVRRGYFRRGPDDEIELLRPALVIVGKPGRK